MKHSIVFLFFFFLFNMIFAQIQDSCKNQIISMFPVDFYDANLEKILSINYDLIRDPDYSQEIAPIITNYFDSLTKENKLQIIHDFTQIIYSERPSDPSLIDEWACKIQSAFLLRDLYLGYALKPEINRAVKLEE